MIQLSQAKKQIAVLYGSSLIGVALGLLSSIVNTRFLPPTEYGDVRYIQNIIQFISIFLLVGFFHSGSRLLTKSGDILYIRRVKGVMCAILLISCIIMALSMPVCSIIHTMSGESKVHLAHLFLISTPVAMCPILLNYLEHTTQGDNQIGRLSLARLLPYLIYVPVAYILYKAYGATSERMLLLQLGISSIVYLAIILSTRPQFKNPGPIWKELKAENKNYGSHLYIGSLVMVATNYLAGISLGQFNSDNTEVGFYTLALTVTYPLITLPAIIGTTHFKNFASQPRIPKHVIRFTLLITFGTFVAFLVLIHPVIKFLYAPEYAVVGTYASYLATGFCIHGIGDMVNRFLGAHGQGKAIRNASIANGVFKVAGYIALVYLFNTPGAIATTILCDVIYLLVMLYYYYKFTNNPAQNG